MEDVTNKFQKDLRHLFGFDEAGKFIGSSGGRPSSEPSPGVSPNDFLEFAIRDLDSGKETYHYVNCLSNCKRAIDSQVEVLIKKIGYKKVATQERWNIPKKLEFIGEFGIITPRILNRINTLRNKLEHEFKAPSKREVEDALDVTVLFLSYSALVDIPSLNWTLSDGLGVRYDYENMIFSFFQKEGNRMLGTNTKDLGIYLKYGDQHFNDFYNFLMKSVPKMSSKDQASS